MPKKLLLLVPLLIALPLFLTGALRRPALAPLPSFTIEAVAIPSDVAPPGLGAAALLERAIERVDPARLAWLHVTLWQRMSDGEVPFESDGTLQLGPEHCARLELTVRSGAVPGRWLVVSDGQALAHVIQLGNDAPAVTSRLLVPPQEAGQPPAAPPDETLRNVGCGGPYPLLVDLRSRLGELTAQSGRLQGRPAVRIRGRLDLGKAAPAVVTAAAADFCYLYLDAQTLWPSRVEWWVGDRTPHARLLLEMEFRNPQLGRPLSFSECIRAFSYRPEGST
jgi:hypothetical protein